MAPLASSTHCRRDCLIDQVHIALNPAIARHTRCRRIETLSRYELIDPSTRHHGGNNKVKLLRRTKARLHPAPVGLLGEVGVWLVGEALKLTRVTFLTTADVVASRPHRRFTTIDDSLAKSVSLLLPHRGTNVKG